MNVEQVATVILSIYTLHGNRNNALVRFINVALNLKCVWFWWSLKNEMPFLFYCTLVNQEYLWRLMFSPKQNADKDYLLLYLHGKNVNSLLPSETVKIIFGSLSDNLCEGRGLQMLLFNLRVHFHQSVVCKSLRSQSIQHGSHVAQGQCLHQVQRLTSP